MCDHLLVEKQLRSSRRDRVPSAARVAVMHELQKKEPRPTGRSESPRRPHGLQLWERTVGGPRVVVDQSSIRKLLLS